MTIVGAGNIACGYDSPKLKYILTHIHAAIKHPAIKLDSIIETEIKKHKNIHNKWGRNINIYSDLKDSMSIYKSDIFVVANPTDQHLLTIKKILKNHSPKLIICEKPIVSNLKELILQNHGSSDGQLLYVSGEMISVDLDQQLLKEGYSIKRIINYRVNHNQNFNDDFIRELKQNMPDMVYVYSQNSGSSFLNFIKIYQLESLWMDTNLMCIGEKTSSILNEIKWKKIFLFNPGEEEFLLYKI